MDGESGGDGADRWNEKSWKENGQDAAVVADRVKQEVYYRMITRYRNKSHVKLQWSHVRAITQITWHI